MEKPTAQDTLEQEECLPVVDMDLKVALKLGWRKTVVGWRKADGSIPLQEPKHYTTDISDAWEIVEWVRKNPEMHMILSPNIGCYICTIAPRLGKELTVAAPTAPLAICRAFLKM